MIYDAADYEGMRKAGKVAAECLDYITPYVQVGVTTGELDDLCREFMINKGAVPACLGYHGYPKSTCISINHVICHGIPGPDRKLADGDILNIDVTAIVDGWYGDTSRMYYAGKPKLKATRLCDVTYECMMRGIDVVKPGAHFGDIGYVIAEYAHKYGVTVEGELGSLSGIEDNINVIENKSFYTNPDQVEDFVRKTNVDSLAVAIGTSHGAYKFKPGQKAELRFDILKEIEKKLPEFPIVLHGASSVIPEFVEEINKFGGNLGKAMGIPESMLKEAAKMAVCKINVDSDLRLAMTAKIRKSLFENPENFDPRKYLSPAREAIELIVKHKIINVLGCAGKA